MSAAHTLTLRSQDLPPPAPGATHTLHAALVRAGETSLGSAALSALLLTGLRALALSARFFGWLPAAAPLAARPYVVPVSAALVWALARVEKAAHARMLSPHALVYVGLTGAPCLPAARRARVLTAAAEGERAGRYKRKFKTERACSPHASAGAR
jgi:hypothetical protein